MKKILKKEINIKTENIIIWKSFTKIDERLLTGRNPPEEIIVIAKLSELNDLMPKIFKIIKIDKVNPEYNNKIFIDCFSVSEELKDKKFVKDFFKLSSQISIKNIIEYKKYKPPIHCIDDLQRIKLWSICFIFSNIVKPVEVKPEIVSKYEFKKVKLYMLR